MSATNSSIENVCNIHGLSDKTFVKQNGNQGFHENLKNNDLLYPACILVIQDVFYFFITKARGTTSKGSISNTLNG